MLIKKYLSRWALVVILILHAPFFLDFPRAEARPGGGHSFKSSRSSRSSSSSRSSTGSGTYRSGGGVFVFSDGSDNGESGSSSVFLVIIIVIVAIVFFAKIMSFNSTSANQTFSTSTPSQTPPFQRQQKNNILPDENFSRVAFFDFVHSLYQKFYSWAGTPQHVHLLPFMSENVKTDFMQILPANEVVIGGLSILRITEDESTQTNEITVVFDANYTKLSGNKNVRYAVDEQWVLSRKKGVLSPAPEKMRTLSCPSCGAPANFNDAGQCQSCQNHIVSGQMEWQIVWRNIEHHEVLKTSFTVSYQQEEGTDYPTIQDNNIEQRKNHFAKKYGYDNWQIFWNPFATNIVTTYFDEIYKAWDQNNWSAARHLLSDRLHESNQYWQDFYKTYGYRNRLQNVVLSRVALASVETDKYYDTVTVRVFASCLDYVTDRNGKVVGGSDEYTRHFTEYWTFMRRSGVEKHATDYDTHNCPSCGAPADRMGQAAECGYCNSKISTGDFSWVLTLITQDEVYQGL